MPPSQSFYFLLWPSRRLYCHYNNNNNNNNNNNDDNNDNNNNFLATEKGSSAWLTVLLQDLGFNLNKREFRDAVKQRYDWPALKDISGEHLNRGSNKVPDARLDIHARGFWE